MSLGQRLDVGPRWKGLGELNGGGQQGAPSRANWALQAGAGRVTEHQVLLG